MGNKPKVFLIRPLRSLYPQIQLHLFCEKAHRLIQEYLFYPAVSQVILWCFGKSGYLSIGTDGKLYLLF